MIRALFKFSKIPEGAVVVDTTSNRHPIYKWLSPFILPAPPAKNLENLWQFSKVYKKHIMPIDGYPDASWYKWRDDGYANDRAVRYPMGKGAIPEYSLWDGEKLDYMNARKKIYAPEYAKNVVVTYSFKALQEQYERCNMHNKELVLLDYDAYDHLKLGMSLVDVINEPNRKMGHAFVLIMMLTGMLDECIQSPTYQGGCRVTIKTELRALPEDIEPHCPKCGQRCRLRVKVGLNEDIYECTDCGMQFEAVIEISWTDI